MVDLPIREGLFHIPESPDDKPYLVGSRCRVCGYTSFPKKEVCLKCRRNDTVEEITFSPYATLENFAVMQVGSPDFPTPYVIGYVRLKEGVVIFTPITGCEARDDALELGEEMELTIEKIREDGQGNNLIGWKFKPTRRKTQ